MLWPVISTGSMCAAFCPCHILLRPEVSGAEHPDQKIRFSGWNKQKNKQTACFLPTWSWFAGYLLLVLMLSLNICREKWRLTLKFTGCSVHPNVWLPVWIKLLWSDWCTLADGSAENKHRPCLHDNIVPRNRNFSFVFSKAPPFTRRRCEIDVCWHGSTRKTENAVACSPYQ